MSFKRRKDGSLSLSMNAIVILILAITLLGLGLTFMRGLFGQIEGKVAEAVSAGEIQNPPNNDRPVTLTPSNVELKSGDRSTVQVAFLNTLSGSDQSFALILYDSFGTPCGASLSQFCGPVNAVYSTQPSKMARDQINVWSLLLEGLQPAVDGETTNEIVSVVVTNDPAYTQVSIPDDQIVEFKKDLVVTVYD